MRTTITRTITVNTIRTAEIGFKDGQPVVMELENITAYGNITKEHATKLARKKYGKNSNVMVLAVEPKDQLFEISIDDFIKHATPVDEETATADEQ